MPSIPRYERVPHYHGDEVRGLFVLSAVFIILAQSTGAELPLSTFGSVVTAAALVIVAGITNPRQVWIHWINAAFAIIGTLLFGTAAVAHYRAGTNVFESSFVYIEALTLLSLLALYFTTRTIRGILVQPPSS